MLYTIFYALDGRELFSCAAADMLPEEKREMKRTLPAENNLQPREIYTVDKLRW